ncbi:MAG: hypothetical protein JST35_04440 [Armatimonadetes bacterium]|jgi:hypothetical protein|nr:hypothetical protein [Armatimonadota bacterium]
MKWIGILAVVLACSVALTGCGSQESKEGQKVQKGDYDGPPGGGAPKGGEEKGPTPGMKPGQ